MSRQESKKGRMNGSGGSVGTVNKKQMSTMNDIYRVPGSVAAHDVEKKVRTVITHNKGGFW